MANPNPLTLTRQQLYELVWTKPVRDVAADFGMSDVALARRCRAVRVPIPSRGYWAKVAAGQKPRKTPLPKHRSSKYTDAASEPKTLDEPTVTFTQRPVPPPTEPETPPSPEEAALRARIDTLEITPLANLTTAHPAVLRTARMLKRPWRKDIEWQRGTQRGPVLQVSNVSEAQMDRALRTLDAVLRAADAMCWHVEGPPRKEEPIRRGHGDWGPRPPEPPLFARLVVDGEALQLKIDERRRQFDHVPTESEKADKKAGRYVWMPRFDFEPSGELRLHLFDADSSLNRRTWKDTAARPLDTQALKILHGLLDRALEIKREREERRLRDLARRDQERQQAMIHARRATHEKLMNELERQAGAWNRAQLLRRYLRAAKRTLGADGYFVKVDDRKVEFLSWAERYVNQLDPLHAEPRDPDFAHERTFQNGADDQRFAEEQQRLPGHAWESCLKLAAAPTDDDPDVGEDDD